MAKHNGISWSLEKNNSEMQSIREQVVDAYLARLIYKYKQLSPREIQLLKRFFSALAGLGPVLGEHQTLSADLKMLIELASNSEAERSNVKVEDVYSVSYGEHVKGIESIKISRNEIRRISRGKMRGVRYGVSTPSSKSYNLLVGEICQYAAKLILRNMTVLGQEVKSIKPLKPPKNIGKRIDDWIITLSNDLQIPVEVKSSKSSRYFNSAFKQIKNTLTVYKYALFIGFSFLPNQASPQKAIVMLVNKTDNLETFSEKVKELLSAKQYSLTNNL